MPVLDNLGFHRITRMTLSSAEQFTGDHSFSVRRLTLTNEEGETFTINIYAAPGEIPLTRPAIHGHSTTTVEA